MRVDKVTVSINADILRQLDRLVSEKVFPSRSRAIQEAVSEKISRIDRHRLRRELAKLDPAEEKAMADEGLALEVEEWPPY
jgi:metal-responsive CopG/Arc/MetJ family transcriptional regulator